MFEDRRAGVEASGVAAPTPAASADVDVREWHHDGKHGVRLYHCEFVPQRPTATGAVVALMHGYGEHCRRYDEFAFELARRGHVVCMLDARGHGQSGGQRGYVLDYADYVADYAAFVERVRARHGARPLVVMGHSNGGLIVVRALQAGLEGARGLLLTGPLLG
ncbi:MAG TPA: alpha/beta fold hydrolase, partial [Polyangiaceae bacterium]|nr:alpha/beta fold hydrolase [Polyangiaceae bacterium]